MCIIHDPLYSLSINTSEAPQNHDFIYLILFNSVYTQQKTFGLSLIHFPETSFDSIKFNAIVSSLF